MCLPACKGSLRPDACTRHHFQFLVELESAWIRASWCLSKAVPSGHPTSFPGSCDYVAGSHDSIAQVSHRVPIPWCHRPLPIGKLWLRKGWHESSMALRKPAEMWACRAAPVTVRPLFLLSRRSLSPRSGVGLARCADWLARGSVPRASFIPGTFNFLTSRRYLMRFRTSSSSGVYRG
jgi:hypothetical protein